MVMFTCATPNSRLLAIKTLDVFDHHSIPPVTHAGVGIYRHKSYNPEYCHKISMTADSSVSSCCSRTRSWGKSDPKGAESRITNTGLANAPYNDQPRDKPHITIRRILLPYCSIRKMVYTYSTQYNNAYYQLSVSIGASHDAKVRVGLMTAVTDPPWNAG